MSSIKKHVVIIPFPAFGHIIPMLELAKKISRQHHVTFVVPPNKLKEIEQRELIDPEHDDVQLFLLEDRVTVDYDTDLEPKQFAEAMKQMVPVHHDFFSRIPCKIDPTGTLLKTPVDAVIADSMFLIIIKACYDRGIPAYMFGCFAAFNIAAMLNFNDDTPTCSDDTFFDGGNEDNNQFQVIQESWKEFVVAVVHTIPYAKAVLVNSFYELETDAKKQWDGHSKNGGVPLKFVGPLFPKDDEKKSGKATTHNQVQKWLDNQQDRSVVYLSFGSMARPVPEQIVEIAKGLLSLKKPFVWSLRSTLYRYLPEEVQNVIAQQFVNSDVPFLILPWAPQKTILGHRSTKVFVSHCGWNSTLESMSNGVPVVAWPMFGDQHWDADFLVRLGTAIRIPKTGFKAVRIIPGTELAQAITTVAGWGGSETSSSYFDKAQEIGHKAVETVAEGGTTYNNLMELLEL